MDFTVTQPFKTPTHRFAEGATVSADDLDGVLAPADWVALGYLAAPQTLGDEPQDEEHPA